MIWRKQSAAFMALAFVLANGMPAVGYALMAAPEFATPADLSFVQIKMTGEEYVVIRNNSEDDIPNLSTYMLRAFNNVNSSLSTATTSTQLLPALRLNQGESLLLSAFIRPTCGASLAGKLSLSLVDGSGTLQILPSASASPALGNIPIDSVSWSSGTASGDITSVPSNTKKPLATFYRYFEAPDSFAWQLAEHSTEDQCSLNVVLANLNDQALVSSSSAGAGGSTEVTLEVISEEYKPSLTESDGNELPLMITELLPNPVGTGTDATDEFIELYNPNDTAINMSGYKLQSGITSTYNYTFPEATTIEPKTYVAVYSNESGLSLSNTSSQVRLTSAAGVTVAATDVYRSAKDGHSWSYLESTWQWSITSTPNKANIVTVLPAVTKQVSAKKPAKPAAAKAVKASKNPKAVKPKKEKTAAAKIFSAAPTAETVMSRPLQMKVVATVGGIAVLYGAYEYRSSFANYYYKLRRKLGFGGPPGR